MLEDIIDEDLDAMAARKVRTGLVASTIDLEAIFVHCIPSLEPPFDGGTIHVQF